MEEEKTMETQFSLVSLAAMLGWLALGFAVVVPPGRWRSRLLLLAGRWVPLGLGLFYAWLLVRHWGSSPGGGFASLAAVQVLFSAPGKMLGGWVHFLAFDLLIGHWMASRVLRRGGPRLPLLMVLPATFLYGPLGLLLYAATQAWRRAPAAEVAS